MIYVILLTMVGIELFKHNHWNFIKKYIIYI